MKLRRLLPYFTILLSLLFSFACLAGDVVRLWNEEGEFVHGYNSIVYGLQAGTQVELRSGQIVTIQGRLGSGGTTAVFDIGNGKALRLPKGDGISPTGVAYEGYISWFATGAEKVARSETPIVKVYSEESWSKRFLVVEKLRPGKDLPSLYTLGDLIAKRVPAEVAERLTRELLEDFSPKTWQLRFVSDMWADQIIYTHHGWVLADLSSNVKFAKAVNDSTLFSAMGKLPPSWRVRLEKKVMQGRRAAELNGSFAESVFAEVRRCSNWLRGLSTTFER